MKKYKWYWCIHHQVLLEPATEPIKNRRKYIKENKPKNEIPTRLKCLKRVKGEIPKEIIAAWEACAKAREARDKACEPRDKAWEARDKAWEARDKAWKAYDKAWNKHKKVLLEMHAKECPDCKFDWDEGIIFKEEGWMRIRKG